MITELSDAQWAQYERDGYLRLGRILNDEDLAALQKRMDDIMLGTAPLDYNQIMMQLDRDPARDNKPGPQTKGHKGATLGYRKIEKLEVDPLFLSYMQHPLFRSICARTYGAATDIGCFRAMFMNKPAGEGTELVWHQDRWTDLDRDPLITIWTALDPATVDNGCVFIAPGMHHKLINPSNGSGFFTEEQALKMVEEIVPVPLELEAGEVALLHNHLPHSSGVNRTTTARRAFSACYLDAATVSASNKTFPTIFGEGALRPASV
ncbi:MAG: phytanoyl-CoA dioxygenase family protein [Chloroflexota bacterium]